jgi:hypothetical protein
MPSGTNAVLPFEATARHDRMLAVMAREYANLCLQQLQQLHLIQLQSAILGAPPVIARLRHPIERTASLTDLPWPVSTLTCRSLPTISSGVLRFTEDLPRAFRIFRYGVPVVQSRPAQLNVSGRSAPTPRRFRILYSLA